MAVNSITGNLAPQISGAIQKAASSTGISFNYLLTTAKIESSFNPTAKASTSSARGLYQFIEQTWLGTVKQDGAALGLGRYADAITKSANGRYTVADPQTRQQIMDLRDDPTTSAMMAGALARDNAFQLTGMIGRRPTEGELYAAHFLGPDGAGKLINAVESQPDRTAATMFPSAAAANRNIFYERDGSARSVGQVYSRLTRRFDNARSVALAAVAPSATGAAQQAGTMTVASADTGAATGTGSAAVVNSFLSAIPIANQTAPGLAGLGRDRGGRAVAGQSTNDAVASGGRRNQDPEAIAQAAIKAAASEKAKVAALNAPDTAGVTQAYADANIHLPPVQDTRPLFQAMFTDPARPPVTQRVASLWAPNSAASAYPGGAPSGAGTQNSAQVSAQALVQGAAQQTLQSPRPLDLFTDTKTDVRGLFHGRG
ncbi:MAG: transglycosylase SLT domain-containing protein [Rhodopseudomonas sp.]|nr:transglycosylase SLT domain-containing protein [Rhodopseudomonas sp.]